MELIYTGPTKATAEAQIEVVNSLVAQQVNAIAISANDAVIAAWLAVIGSRRAGRRLTESMLAAAEVQGRPSPFPSGLRASPRAI